MELQITVELWVLSVEPQVTVELWVLSVELQVTVELWVLSVEPQVTVELCVLSAELVSCPLSGADNFKVASRFLEKALSMIHNVSEAPSSVSFVCKCFVSGLPQASVCCC